MKHQRAPDKANPIAPRSAKTLWSFGHPECNRVNVETVCTILLPAETAEAESRGLTQQEAIYHAQETRQEARDH